MKYKFYIVDVFSNEAFGGNQLAVLPDAAGISTLGMQQVAREFNFAESTFVFPPENTNATAKVRIFTPKAEVDFAGHPTVGTACVLVHASYTDNLQLTLEENIGPISVTVSRNAKALGATLTNTQLLDHPNNKPDSRALTQVLQISNSDIADSFYASVGLDFLFHTTQNSYGR